VRNDIVTINVALTVSLLLVLFLTTYFWTITDELLFWSRCWQIMREVGSTY
jgi:pilus assembly protein TadC